MRGLRVLFYLLAFILFVVGCALVGWGIVEQRSTLRSDVGLEAVGIYMNAAFHAALGAAALAFGALCSVAGVATRQ